MGTNYGIVGLTMGAALLGGCFDWEQPATNQQVRDALAEVVLTGEALALEDGIVEITTSFTIGDGIEAIANEVRSFAQSQVPCSTVQSPQPGTLVIDFGELGDACRYRGKTYAGVVTVQWELGDEAVVVTHDYDAITNGHVTLDGQAVVTWRERSRQVQTDLQFAGEDATVEVQSDRTQSLLGDRVEDGIKIVGYRDWSGPAGAWELDIDDVEFRLIDPIPQAGSYTLTTPQEQELTMSFERIDGDTIEVSVTGGRRDIVFRVTALGVIEEV